MVSFSLLNTCWVVSVGWPRVPVVREQKVREKESRKSVREQKV